MKKILLSFLVVSVLTVAALSAYEWYRDNRFPNITGNTSFKVYPDTTPEDVVAVLADSKVVKDPVRLAKVFRSKHVDRYIKPGNYFVNNGNTSAYVARMLNNGWQSPVNLTLSGTMRRTADIARRIGKQMLADSASVQDCLRDTAFIDSLGYSRTTLLSLFIPDTYQMYWTASPRQIITRLKDENDAFWTEENLDKARGIGLSREQVSVLASIVTAESTYAPEMPKIAGVYLNRLKAGMLLQADPTVAFCFDYEPQRILTRHLEIDSPYNTYRYAGLPPGPICVPSRESLLAVLNPDCKDGYLYFCANPDFSGTHLFSRTLSGHNANARAFQAELNRRHRAKKNSSK